MKNNFKEQVSSYSDQDLAYMRSLSAAVVSRSSGFLVKTVTIIFLFFFAALLWMNWADIDMVVRGQGKVIPASKVQFVQSLEGGVVAEILVSEGDLIEAGQALVKISDVAFASSFQENQLKHDELKARSVRLRAEAYSQPFLPEEALANQSPKLIASEKSLYESNQAQLSETFRIYNEQIIQHQRALEEAKTKAKQLSKNLGLLKQELRIKRPLMRDGIISEIDFLQLQQRESELEGELEISQISVSRTESLIKESRGKLEQSRLDFQNQAKRELNEVLAEISRIAQTQTALEDRVSRTILRSPVKGVVKRLHANSIGGVVAPGGEVLEIVPLGDSLLVEVKIKPSDIASISVGQKTRLKFSAYDFAIHGSLGGEMTFVSADTITNEEGQSFYVVRVRPDELKLDDGPRAMEIKIGMTSEADIITSKKTVLEYLLNPINRGFQKALTES